MIIRRISKGLSIEAVKEALIQTAPVVINQINWKDSYPYAPFVSLSLAHDGDYLYLQYDVSEQNSLVLQDHDFGEIWTDSCVECFIAFGDGYYNLEFNAIGYGLASWRLSREEAKEDVSCEIMKKIERYPSLPIETFKEMSLSPWSLFLKVPKELFFKEKLDTFTGIKAKANFYKCGDHLSEPHFVSWAPIYTEKPDFHQKKFFSDVEFE